MDKKKILAGIPVVALLFAIILPILSISATTTLRYTVPDQGIALFKLFETGGNTLLGLVFLLVPIVVAYCAYTNKYMQYAPLALLIPFIWLLIWKGDMVSEGLQELGIKFSINIGVGAWIYLVLSVIEIVLVLKPDLLDNLLAKKQQ